MYNTIANLLVGVGLIACVVALAGSFYGESPLVVGLLPSNLALAGIALMVLGCYARLASKS